MSSALLARETDTTSDHAGDDADDSSAASFADWASADEDARVASILAPGARSFATAADAWAELEKATGFCFATVSTRDGWETYDLVRFVNYLRSAAHGVEEEGEEAVLDALLVALDPSNLVRGSPLWVSDSYLLPVLTADPLLMSVLGDEVDASEEESAPPPPFSPPPSCCVDS